MRVLLSTYGSRGDVEPLVATRGAVAGARRGGAGVRAAGRGFAERLAGVGVPLVPVGRPVRALMTGRRRRRRRTCPGARPS